MKCRFVLLFALLGVWAGPVVAEPWKFMVFGDSRGVGADTNDLGQQINTNILGNSFTTNRGFYRARAE